jgi:glycosyltransferase involved in cell wall biosynthesis|tara:strand:- start:561 stop:1205 length:645 start_codon:yes stop_codon:yes gene_type:complete
MDNISVIIRCRNEESHIGLSMQSVLDYFKNPEIIIIDNQSTDESMKVVSLFDRCDIKKYSLNGNYTPGKALNFGAKKATNNTLLVLSAHSQITKLDKVKLKEDLNNHVAVFGNQTPIYRGKRISKRYIWSHFKENRVINLFSKIENRQFLHNAFCFYNRDFLLKNPFDEKLHGKEDRYWAIDIVDKGYTYLYDGITHKCNHYWTTNGATWKGIG